MLIMIISPYIFLKDR